MFRRLSAYFIVILSNGAQTAHKTIFAKIKQSLAKSCKRLFYVIYAGAGERTRTPDLRITNALLYRLSYTSILNFIKGLNLPGCRYKAVNKKILTDDIPLNCKNPTDRSWYSTNALPCQLSCYGKLILINYIRLFEKSQENFEKLFEIQKKVWYN